MNSFSRRSAFVKAAKPSGQLFENCVAEFLEGTLLVLFTDEERDVVVRTSVAYHAYRDVLEGIECDGLEANVAPVKVAYYADDTHVGIDGHGALFLQLVDNLAQVC